MVELSVVLISKDQEWNISRLVESVLKETALLPAKEIVLVDSASTDQTTEIAASYPITVLKLCPGQRLTAAAGRYIGYKQTIGDMVLFLDGDMELCNGWLHPALQIMQCQPSAAVVTGKVINRPKSTQTPREILLDPSDDHSGITIVRQGGGAAMYRRSILEQVGQFNPYLYSDEEPELCLRIRHAGYQVLRMSRPIAFHYSAPTENLSSLLGRRKRNLWLGFGQNIRYMSTSPMLWPYIRERGWVVAPAVTLFIGAVLAMASVLTGTWMWLVLWVAFVAILTIGIAIGKRSMKRALFSILQRMLIFEGTIQGLMLEPYDPAGYPGRYDVIQDVK